MSHEPMSDQALVKLQRDTFGYFKRAKPISRTVWSRTAPERDRMRASRRLDWELASYPIVVEQAFISREEAAARVLTTLRFWHSPQERKLTRLATQGFYYHFLHMDTGRRAWECELSTIDSAILIAGALAAATYFDQPDRTRTSD